MRVRAKLAATGGLALAALILVPGVASAHEDRQVRDLGFVVGFGTEPAYAGQPNSVQLILSHAGEPVTDLGDTVSVQVSFGDKSVDLPLEPFFEIGEFGTPGDYRAWFVPTQPGAYTFRFTGEIDGEEVDESFTSGPRTFGEVQDIAAAEFPGVEAPTTTELADRIEREAARTQDAVAAAAGAASRADEAAKSARIVGVVGIAVGGIGIVLGAVSLVMRRKV
jgi:hypothetical protein